MPDPDAQKAKRVIEETAKKGVPLKEGEEPSLAGISREEFGAGLAGGSTHQERVRRQARKARWVRIEMQKTGKGYWEAEAEWRRQARANRDKYYKQTVEERNPYNKEMKKVRAIQEIDTPDGRKDIPIQKEIPTGRTINPLGDAMKVARRGVEEFARKRGLQTILRNGEIFVKRGANPALAMYGVNDVQGGTTERYQTPDGQKVNEFWSNGQLQQVIVDKGNGKYQIIKNAKKLKQYQQEQAVQLGEAQTLEAPVADVGAERADMRTADRPREAL